MAKIFGFESPFAFMACKVSTLEKYVIGTISILSKVQILALTMVGLGIMRNLLLVE